MQNVEFKAELRDLEAARQQCRLLGARRLGEARQVDTYYRLADGRLKRREVDGSPAEWIFYHRHDRVSPKLSTYSILTDQQARRRWGKRSLRPWLTVSKVREIWLIDDTRIHLDQVDQLGRYIEFEAIVSAERGIEACGDTVVSLREAFAPVLGEPVAVSYSDLIQQLQAGDGSG